MKINKILLRNINSFRGEHTIDFGAEPLSTAGLFAIVGPTGAGKSTLLDAITLALFNRIPRFDKGISKNAIATAGMILTRGERECLIEVEYSCKAGTYISKWGISLTRNNTFNDYTMELADAKTNEGFALKKSDIPDKNQQLIGLSYDQFIKSILLSQGEFARFLKSNKDERGKLMEDITGMQIYRKLGQKAYEIYKEKGQKLDEKIAERTTHQRDAIPENELNGKTAAAAAMREQIETNNIEIKKLENQIALKNELVTLQKQLEEQSEGAKKAQIEWDDFCQNKEPKLKKHERAEPLRDEVAAIENTITTFGKLKETQQQETERLKKDEADLGKSCQKIAAFCNIECDNDTALPNLSAYQSEIGKRQDEAKNAQKDVEVARENLKESLKNIDLDQLKGFDCLKVNNESLNLVEKIAKNIKQQIEDAKSKIALLPDQAIENLLTEIEQKIPLFEDLGRIVKSYAEKDADKKNKTDNLKQQQEQVDLYQPLIETITKEITDLEQQIEQLRKQKDKAKESYNFDKDRNKLLKANEPCPLCGSLEHPYLSHYASQYLEIDVRLQAHEKQLKNQQKQQTTYVANRVAALGLVQKLNEDIEILQKTITQALSEIDSKKNELNLDKIGNQQWVITQISELKERQQDIKKVIENQQIIKLLGDLYRNVKRTKENQEQFDLKNNELKKQYAGHDINKDCNELSNSFTKLQANVKTRNEQIDSLTQQIKTQEPIIEKQKEQIESKLKEADFENIEIFKTCLLAPTAAKQLRDEQQNIKQRTESFGKGIEIYNRQIDDKKKDDVADEQSTIEEKKQTIALAKKQNDEALIKLSSEITNQNNLIGKIKSLDQEIEKEEKANLKWQLLNSYIGDREGKKFSTFAQALTLKQLIGFANERLKTLTDRYLLDKPTDDEDDLMVLDLYIGNERRTVKTLSGGETFLVSLSLALALSDLASRHVKLESLFIDEGFGTLDPETLDTALSTLEKLQQQDRKNIGIISHVESIKQRITTQIHLEKNNRGFSTIKIV